MNLSRWKLLAGVFGLSVCGLAALAEPACRTAGHGSRQLPPVAENKSDAKPAKGGTTLPPPIPVAPPKPVELPAIPGSAPLPSLPQALPSLGDPVVKPALPDPFELSLPMVKEDKPKTDALPAFPLPPMSATPNVPAATAVPEPISTGLPALPGCPVQLSVAKPDLPDLSPAPPQAPEVKPVPLPQPVEAKPLPRPQPVDVQSIYNAVPPVPPVTPTPVPTPPAPAPEVRTVAARSATPTVEKRLKVTLQMGDGNPRFEIRDGDEVVLKVTSDKIDVTAPTEKGDLWSTLKASGRVKFYSPGGDGYCDELVIVPGSCEVIATGKVQFKYNWGKVETAVTSERMTFRLGATPNGK